MIVSGSRQSQVGTPVTPISNLLQNLLFFLFLIETEVFEGQEWGRERGQCTVPLHTSNLPDLMQVHTTIASVVVCVSPPAGQTLGTSLSGPHVGMRVHSGLAPQKLELQKTC